MRHFSERNSSNGGFTDWLQAYMHWTRISESPDSFHFWTGISTIAGALRRRVWIDMRSFQWTPNFYIILVGPPGVATKSTSIRLGMSLLGKVPGVKFGERSVTWQALISALEEATEVVEISKGVLIPMSCLTVVAPELGSFLRPDQSEFMDNLTDLWDGQIENWGRRTKLEGSTQVQNPWLNLIACTTPSWLKNNMPEVMITGGLASRTIFVYGDEKRQRIPFPDEIITEEEDMVLRGQLLDDLKQIALLKGKYTITVAARNWGHEWYEQHWTEKDPRRHSDRYAGYWARKQTAIFKIAMTLSAARRDSLTIELHDLQDALTLMTGVEIHMAKVFDSIGMVDSAQKLNIIVQVLKAYPRVENRVLWKEVLSQMSPKEYQDAIYSGMKAGLLRVVTEEGKQLIVKIE